MEEEEELRGGGDVRSCKEEELQGRGGVRRRRFKEEVEVR